MAERDAMQRILIRDLEAIATFDEEGRELRGGWLLVEGSRICLLYTSPSPRD